MDTEEAKKRDSLDDLQTYNIIGAAMEVHRRLGCGFLEGVYQEALAVELAYQEIPFAREVPINIYYRNDLLACAYRADFVCYGEIILEIKAIQQLTKIEFAQTINYLKATGYHRALLLNFGEESLGHRRFINKLTQAQVIKTEF